MDPIYLPLPEERRGLCLFLAAADQKAWMDLLLNPKREWVENFANGLPAFLFALVWTHERDTLELEEPITDHEAVHLLREVEREWQKRGETLTTRQKTFALVGDVGYLSIYFRFDQAFTFENLEGFLSRWAVGLEEIVGLPPVPPGLMRIYFLLGPILRAWRRHLFYYSPDLLIYHIHAQPDMDLISLCSTLIRKEEVPEAHKRILMDVALTAAAGKEERLSQLWHKQRYYLLSPYMRGTWNDELKAKWGPWWAREDAPRARKQMEEYAERLRKEALEWYGCRALFPEFWKWQEMLAAFLEEERRKEKSARRR